MEVSGMLALLVKVVNQKHILEGGGWRQTPFNTKWGQGWPHQFPL